MKKKLKNECKQTKEEEEEEVENLTEARKECGTNQRR